MSAYTSLILIQSLFILALIYILKKRNKQVPDFDTWLSRNMQHNPNIGIEEAFDEYIREYNIMVLQEADEPNLVSQARTKMKLIEEYDIDEILGENEHYLGYKMSLERTLDK
ncbi:MAG: hypothetical protein WD059_14155 [Balneolaceae bacterium]